MGSVTKMIADDRQAAAEFAAVCESLKHEIGKRIVGQHEALDSLLISLFSGGHSLFVGVPGLAKTLLISSLAEVLDLEFSRVQFTPDLMPADITGTDVLMTDRASGHREFEFIKGPVFTNILLADEINRSPPKTQAALLQSMQEGQVTAGGRTHDLPNPYLVFATQNPIEQEGTYPLPEAELDRFMFFIGVNYPKEQEERIIVQSTTAPSLPVLSKILSPRLIQSFQSLVRRVPAADELVDYAVRLVRATRPSKANPSQMVNEYISWGAGPRASQYLVLGGKARALMMDRHAVNAQDIQALALPVLRHRVIANFHAEVSGLGTQDVIEHLLEVIPS
jgi:MoxR-like ATPase